jgi:hypothetical protein
MQRRDFLKKSTTAAAVLLASPSVLVVEGCNVNVKALLNTVLDSAQAILRVAAPNEGWITPLQSAIVALEQAEQQWSAGGAVQIVISALNSVQSVLAVIPITAVYSPLIAVLVAGIEAVLVALVPQPAPNPATVNAAHNPYLSTHRITLRRPRILQTHQGAYRSQWNSTASDLGLPKAQI